MTDVVGPFDTSTWSQTEWARHMLPVMPSGVIDSPAAAYNAGGLALLTSGLNWGLDQGRANVGGFGFYRTGTQAADQAITANTNATLYRRDRVVLRRSLATNTVAAVRIQGTPASTPVPPAITQTDTVWDATMFSFLVPPASGTILSGFVDERDWLVPQGFRGAITPASGWGAGYANYAAAGYHLSPDGLVTLSGMVQRTGANIVLNGTSGSPVTFATLPAAIVPSTDIAPEAYFGSASPVQTVSARLYCVGGSTALQVTPMDAGTYTVYTTQGFVNLDGVSWHI